ADRAHTAGLTHGSDLAARVGPGGPLGARDLEGYRLVVGRDRGEQGAHAVSTETPDQPVAAHLERVAVGQRGDVRRQSGEGEVHWGQLSTHQGRLWWAVPG